jgi:hypothetical protein
MEKMIAFCGLTCSQCPTFIATQQDDDEERARVAKMWSEQFKMQFTPEDINCDGCLSAGDRLFNYCRVCDIRKCGRSRDVLNCAHCDEYGCEKLTKFLNMAPEAKKSLEQIRQNL